MPKMLVIDDSRFSRNRTVAALREGGYEVLEAGDGAEGLALLASSAPDCVVLDLLMPVMDGLEFLKRKAECNSSVPVIVLSADIQVTSRQFAEQYGAQAFLNKPLQADELRRVVAGLITVQGAPA